MPGTVLDTDQQPVSPGVTTAAPTWQLWVATGLRLVLAGVLGVAGALKVPDQAESVRSVRAYDLLPETLVPAIGYGLPLLELAIAVLLLLGLFIRWAAAVTAVLMAGFVIGIAAAWTRGLTIDCGCFGGGGQVGAADTRYLQEIGRDVALLVAALVLVRWPASRLALDPAPAEEPKESP